MLFDTSLSAASGAFRRRWSGVSRGGVLNLEATHLRLMCCPRICKVAGRWLVNTVCTSYFPTAFSAPSKSWRSFRARLEIEESEQTRRKLNLTDYLWDFLLLIIGFTRFIWQLNKLMPGGGWTVTRLETTGTRFERQIAFREASLGWVRCFDSGVVVLAKVNHFKNWVIYYKASHKYRFLVQAENTNYLIFTVKINVSSLFTIIDQRDKK